jgi:hypothetical protein
MRKEVNNKTTCHCFIRSATKENLNKTLDTQSRYKFKSTVILCYAYDEKLVTSSSYNSNRYPLLLYSINESAIYYYNLAGRGNSPTFNYNTKESEYGNLTPYGSTTIDNMISWINKAKENNPNGDNILIISRILTSGSV